MIYLKSSKSCNFAAFFKPWSTTIQLNFKNSEINKHVTPPVASEPVTPAQ